MGDPQERERTPEEFEEVEAKMFTMEQSECPVTHTFGPGVYIREVRLPAGALVLGAEQRFHHMNIFISGKILMVQPDGTHVEMTAPQMFVGSPGRKMGYVLEDAVWLNVYPTEERDVETLEKTYLKKTKTKVSRDKEMQRIRAIEYSEALKEIGVSEEGVQEEMRLQPVGDLPFGTYKIGIFSHGVEGRGVFATSNIEEGEVIAPAAIGPIKTPVGRFTNHSSRPNARMVQMGSDVYLVSTLKIHGMEGGDLGEEVVTDYRETRKDLLCHQQ
jgi:hypothetical protein